MLILSLWACVTAQTYPQTLATVVCRRFDECGVLADEVSGDECVDALVADLDGEGDGCTFQGAAAHQCLELLRTTSCVDLFTGDAGGDICTEVWTDCPGD